MNLVLGCILAYVASQLLIAYWYSRRRNRTEEDYVVAGRSLGPWMTMFAVFATWFGAETCIGAAGEAYERGLSGVISVGSSRVDLQACKLEYSIVSPK